MRIFTRKHGPARTFDIPQGAFTYDSEGRILVGTLPIAWLESFGPALVKAFRRSFASAEEKGFPLHEIALHYGGARITAKDLRGGAIVFVSPKRKQP